MLYSGQLGMYQRTAIPLKGRCNQQTSRTNPRCNASTQKRNTVSGTSKRGTSTLSTKPKTVGSGKVRQELRCYSICCASSPAVRESWLRACGSTILLG